MTDINEQFWALIEAHIPEQPWNPSQVAEQAVADVRLHAPRLLQRWLSENAVRFVHEELNRRNIADRSRVRRSVRVQQFAAAVTAAEAGDLTDLERVAAAFWETRWNVVVDGVHLDKPLFDLDGSDCGYLAGEYRRTESHSRMHAIFFEQVQVQVGNRRIADVFEPAVISTLFGELARGI